MRDVDGIKDLSGDTQCAPQFELTLVTQGRAEVTLGDVRHRDEEDTVLLARVKDGNDVRMLERGSQP